MSLMGLSKHSRRQFFQIILLLLATASQIWYLNDHSRLNPDEAFPLGQALSLLEGDGLTVQSSKPQDISSLISVVNLRSPLGVAISIAVFTALFNDPGVADFVLEIIGTVLFFVSWFWILDKQKKINFWGKTFTWLLWIFFPAPLMAGVITAHTTETLSLSLFMASMVLGAILVSKNNKKSIFILGSLIGIVSGLAASLRYMYWPMLAILPTAIFIFGLMKRKLKLFSGAILANIAFSSIFLLTMMLLNLKITGHLVGYSTDIYGQIVTRLPETQTLHWEHLDRTIPFPLFTFGVSDPSFMATRVIIEEPPMLPSVAGLSWLLSGIMLAAFLFYMWKTLSPWWSSLFQRQEVITPVDSNENPEFISLIALITFTLIMSTLAYLSIDIEPHPFGGGWVPVMELRYYSATFVFFTLAVGYLISQIKNKKRTIRYFSYTMNIIAIALLFLVGAWRVQLGYQQLYSPDKYFTGEERYERETKLLTILEKSIVEEFPVVVIYPEKDSTIRRKTLDKGFVVCPLETIPPSPALATSATVNALLVYRDSEPESTKAYFDGLADKYEGVCINRGNFTGCHILFTP